MTRNPFIWRWLERIFGALNKTRFQFGLKVKKKFTEKFKNHFLIKFVGVKLADLKPLRTHDLATNKIRHDLMREIQGVTQLHTGKVALACATGLHLLSSTGTNNFKKVNISKKSM